MKGRTGSIDAPKRASMAVLVLLARPILWDELDAPWAITARANQNSSLIPEGKLAPFRHCGAVYGGRDRDLGLLRIRSGAQLARAEVAPAPAPRRHRTRPSWDRPRSGYSLDVGACPLLARVQIPISGHVWGIHAIGGAPIMKGAESTEIVRRFELASLRHAHNGGAAEFRRMRLNLESFTESSV
jgi:hypothetical protein